MNRRLRHFGFGFFAGSVIGIFQAEYPWVGGQAIANNVGFTTAYGMMRGVVFSLVGFLKPKSMLEQSPSAEPSPTQRSQADPPSPADTPLQPSILAQLSPGIGDEEVVIRAKPGYIALHWRGQHSLAKSYWINTFLLTAALMILSALADPTFQTLDFLPGLVIGLATIVISIAVGIWQLVGLWRSATRTSAETRKVFWPGVAKVLVVVNVIFSSVTYFSFGSDIYRAVEMMQTPLFNDYQVEMFEETDLLLTGAINF